MSFWADLRDAVEVVGTGVLQYYYPGSGMLTSGMVSKGIQNTPEYGYMMTGVGLAGAYGGNMSNYGSTLSSMSNMGQAPNWYTAGGYGGEAGSAGGIGGAGMSGSGQAVQQLIDQGYTQEQALEIAQQQGGQASGAAPTFSGQQDMAGAQGSLNGQDGISGLGGVPGSGGGLIGGPSGGSAFGTGSTGGMAGGPSAGPGSIAAGAGAMPWGSAGNMMTMGSGLYGMYQSEQMQKQAQQAQQQADPFGPYRAQYAQQMQALTADPSKITQQPGYQAGLDAVQRSMAAQGYTGSGNMMAALSKYGGDFYNQTMQMYSNLAGAQFNPAAGAQLGMQGQSNSTNLMMNSLGLLAKGTQMAGGQGNPYGNAGNMGNTYGTGSGSASNWGS